MKWRLLESFWTPQFCRSVHPFYSSHLLLRPMLARHLCRVATCPTSPLRKFCFSPAPVIRTRLWNAACDVRPLHTTPPICLASLTQQQSSRTISAPFASIQSSVARLLPLSAGQDSLSISRPLAEDIVGRTLEQVRTAAQAPTVDEAKGQWAMLDAQIRSELAERDYLAGALTSLASTIISASSDPRRHAVAFNLYRIAFGSDPVALPAIELSTDDLKVSDEQSTAPFEHDGGMSSWGDWQAAYHWAALVLQGRAPPPPGTFLLVPGEQRLAQASQSAAAYRVFAHLAKQGHARGIFGIGRHLLSTLEKNVDPTALASMPATSISPGSSLSRQETLAEVERLYEIAGRGGVEEAWFELGALYAEGKWVRKDDAKARSFLEQGAERNSPRACQALASLLTREAQAPKTPASLDLGGKSDVNESADTPKLQRALELLERGARLGSAECAFAAGMRHLLRPQTTDNAAQAGPPSFDASLDVSAPSHATAVEDPEVRSRREHMAQWGIEPDDEQATTWLALAVEGGNTLAMMNLARMHLEGRATSTAGLTRKQQLMEASDLYAKILSKAMGPEGQKQKAMDEVNAKIAQARGGKPEPTLSAGSGRLDDLAIRAEEGMRMIKEELETLA